MFGVHDCGNREQKTSYIAGICSGWRVSSSGRKTSPLKAEPDKRKPEENPAGNQTEKEEKKRSWWNVGKKTEPEENNKIKPADLPHIQTNAVTHPRNQFPAMKYQF